MRARRYFRIYVREELIQEIITPAFDEQRTEAAQVTLLFFDVGEVRHVHTYFGMLLELINKPLQQLTALRWHDCHCQMETWLVQRIRHMPPSARNVDHVAILKNTVPYRIFL